MDSFPGGYQNNAVYIYSSTKCTVRYVYFQLYVKFFDKRIQFHTLSKPDYNIIIETHTKFIMTQ